MKRPQDWSPDDKLTVVLEEISLSEEDLGAYLRSRGLHDAHFAFDRFGQQYDLKNIIDLARYLIPTPFVPNRWRRRLLALGSGDPT